jgi:FMN phosphatase YigB (HAD superfamily)
MIPNMPVKTVLFDLGNVLSHDGHETYLTDREYGLALSLGEPKEVVTQKVNHIFRKYAVMAEASEPDFWAEIASTLGIELSPKSIDTVKEQITSINPEAIKSFELLKEHGIHIGIISNSSPFFYKAQAEPLSLTNYADSDLMFLSHKLGRLKSEGLFELAAQAVQPATTCIIDDRLKNVEYAQKLGFQAATYSFESGDSLLSLVEKIATQ